MELNGFVSWVGCCAVVLCLGVLTAVAGLVLLLRSAMNRLAAAESRSREMAMAVVDDWRKIRMAELDAGSREDHSPDPKPDNGFPEQLLGTQGNTMNFP